MKRDLEKSWDITLVPYDENWVAQFNHEKLKVEKILAGNCRAIQHIGSTAIKNIYAKPVIDILVVVNDLTSVDGLNADFEALRYVCMGEYGIEGRRFYWKSKAERTHHIHLFEQGNSEIKRHLAFRDHMINDPLAAQGYSWIKRSLAEQFPCDIESYVNGKASFVRAMEYRAGVAREDQLNAPDNITLEPPNPNWKKFAAAEINAIKQSVDLSFLSIEHLGSTAIEGLSAKPIIDIFIALEDMKEALQWLEPLKALGYIDWPDNPDKTHHRYFKGMPPWGLQRTHHVHIMAMGVAFKRRIAFRNLLEKNAQLREDYELVKQKLAYQHPNDREAYTNAKAHLIKQVLEDDNEESI